MLRVRLISNLKSTVNLRAATAVCSALLVLSETSRAQTARWIDVTPGGAGPRAEHALAYDSVRGVTVLFGGDDGAGGKVFESDTWEWDGSTWTRRATDGPS